MNIDAIDPEILASRKALFAAVLAEDEDESQNVLPLKLQIEQVETELNQHKTEYLSLDDVFLK